jgi:hypothetical protein
MSQYFDNDLHALKNLYVKEQLINTDPISNNFTFSGEMQAGLNQQFIFSVRPSISGVYLVTLKGGDYTESVVTTNDKLKSIRTIDDTETIYTYRSAKMINNTTTQSNIVDIFTSDNFTFDTSANLLRFYITKHATKKKIYKFYLQLIPITPLMSFVTSTTE